MLATVWQIWSVSLTHRKRKCNYICWNFLRKSSWNHIKWTYFVAGFSYLEPLWLVGYVDGEDCYVVHRRSGTAPILIVLDQFKLPQRKAPMTEHDRDRCTYTAHRLECWMRTHINIMNKADTRHSRSFPHYFTTYASKETFNEKITFQVNDIPEDWHLVLNSTYLPDRCKTRNQFSSTICVSRKAIFPNSFFNTFWSYAK